MQAVSVVQGASERCAVGGGCLAAVLCVCMYI